VLERLWAGWRNDYVRSIPEAGTRANSPEGATLFEGLLAAHDAGEEVWIVHRGDLISVILNAYPYGSGHVLVIPNRGVEKVSELTSDEAAVLWATVDHAVRVVEAAYEAPGINVGLNQGKAAGAGVPDHLHVHVLARWLGDTNFMTAVAETRVLPESLEVTAERLRSLWATVEPR